MPRDKSDSGTALENAGGGATAAAPSDVPSPPNAPLRTAAPLGSPDAAPSPSLQEYREARRGPIPQQVDAVPLEVAAPSMARRKRLDVTVAGGRYIVGARFDEETGQHMGGQVVDANSKVLATFEPDQVNTGNPEDGKKPEPPQP